MERICAAAPICSDYTRTPGTKLLTCAPVSPPIRCTRLTPSVLAGPWCPPHGPQRPHTHVWSVVVQHTGCANATFCSAATSRIWTNDGGRDAACGVAPYGSLGRKGRFSSHWGIGRGLTLMEPRAWRPPELGNEAQQCLNVIIRFAQFISICRWLPLIHKDRLAPLENAPFPMLWVRKRSHVAQRFHQYLRATNR